MKSKVLSLTFVLVVAAGCKNAAGPTPVASSGGGAGVPPSPTIPTELKNDAYDYYGLSNEKPVQLEITYSDNPVPATGSRRVVLQDVKDGKATFVQKQEGALVGEGDITLSLEKDGVYAMSSTKGKIKEHSLEIPASLSVGGGWKDHTELEQQGTSIKLDNDVKIVGKERVSTKGGTFDDALYVTSVGKGTLGDQQVTLTTRSWYVRGKGPVKQIVEVVPAKGAKRTISMQLLPDSGAGATK